MLSRWSFENLSDSRKEGDSLPQRVSTAWTWFKAACKKALWEDFRTFIKFLIATLLTAGFSLLFLSLVVSQGDIGRTTAYLLNIPLGIGLNFLLNWKFTWKGRPALWRSLWRWTVVQLLLIPLGYQLFQSFGGLDLEYRLAKVVAGVLLFVPAYLIAYFWAFADRWRSGRNNRQTIVT